MNERWFSFNGFAVFDHEENRFWNRKRIKELGLEMWTDAEMPKKNPNNTELLWIFIQEFDQFCDKETYKNRYWDDEGRWELIELPYHIGFGIIEGDTERFREIVRGETQ